MDGRAGTWPGGMGRTSVLDVLDRGLAMWKHGNAMSNQNRQAESIRPWPWPN
jgi:hypothetical protein